MTVFATLPLGDQGAADAIRQLLAQLLENNIVDAVMAPIATRDGRSVQPGLIRRTEQLAAVDPLMPVMPLSEARMVQLLTERCPENGNAHEHPFRAAVVLRPCQLRATIELAKLHQLSMDQLLTIGMDCVGTYEPPDYQNAAEDSTAWTAAVLGAAREGNPDSPNGLPYRPACQICETPAPWNADIALHTIGVDTSSRVLAAIEDDALAVALGLETGGEDGGRNQVVDSLIATRRERRQANLDEMAAMLATQEDGTAGLLALFETCQRCHNCTTACPICYCKQCLFQTRTFEHEPRRFYGWAARKGAARLPGDTIAFQLTRLSHVTTSCVGCGLCTSACPADLPVDRLFQTVARETQALLEYVPGRDLAETLPTATFRKDEFVEIGERG